MMASETRTSGFLTSLASLCLLFLSESAAAADTPQHSTEEWQAMARTDLDAVHDAIVRGHPGAIDEQNPGFKVWMEDGYHEALRLVDRVDSYDGVLAAVRYYVSGFRDGHLAYSGDVRPGDRLDFSGWSVERTPAGYRVNVTVGGTGQAVPPLGSTLVDCDGQPPDLLIEQRVAPFYDRRVPPAAWVVARLGVRGLESNALQNCKFLTTDGNTLSLAVDYRSLGPDDWLPLLQNSRRGGSRTDRFTFRNGVLWIESPNFNPDKDDAKSLRRMLHRLKRLQGVRAIVFDVRGNGGGDSSVGDEIFDAATGGLVFDTRNLERLPQVYAEWRISEFSLRSADDHVNKMQATYGTNSPQAAEAREKQQALEREQRSGALWHRQWEDGLDGYQLDSAEIARRHGHLRRFHGAVVLLTDETCASACLDFADRVHQTPGAVQVGHTTSSDTVYIDVGFFRMPSGNRLVMPLKVWRNRLRGDSVPWVPDEPIPGSLDDDAVRSSVAAILDRRFGIHAN